MYMNTRDEEVALIKRLWRGEPTECPKCHRAQLVLLHKKAKKSTSDWRCPACDEIFRTINMLYEIQNL